MSSFDLFLYAVSFGVIVSVIGIVVIAIKIFRRF